MLSSVTLNCHEFRFSIVRIVTAVLENVLIFGKNSSHKASACLRGGGPGGGLNRYLAEFRLNIIFVLQGLTLTQF